jgi:AcrR family transcriptional regulator
LARIDPTRRAEIGLERRARTRAQLVEAARFLFTSRPIDSVTVEDVTKQARLAKGTFSQHAYRRIVVCDQD